MVTAKELGEQLDMIAGKAKALRESGVIGRVSIGDVHFEVGEPVSAEPAHAAADAEPPPNALDDGDTYGGFVPQRRGPSIPPRDDDD